jgi:hypothetical protein
MWFFLLAPLVSRHATRRGAWNQGCGCSGDARTERRRRRQKTGVALFSGVPPPTDPQRDERGGAGRPPPPARPSTTATATTVKWGLHNNSRTLTKHDGLLPFDMASRNWNWNISRHNSTALLASPQFALAGAHTSLGVEDTSTWRYLPAGLLCRPSSWGAYDDMVGTHPSPIIHISTNQAKHSMTVNQERSFRFAFYHFILHNETPHCRRCILRLTASSKRNMVALKARVNGFLLFIWWLWRFCTRTHWHVKSDCRQWPL